MGVAKEKTGKDPEPVDSAKQLPLPEKKGELFEKEPVDEGSLWDVYHKHKSTPTSDTYSSRGFAELAVYPGVSFRLKSKETTDDSSIN